MDVTNLYDEVLYLIFKKLNKNVDQNSFGLTCHSFLDIQNLSVKCLKLRYKSHPDYIILEKLLNRFRNLHSLSLYGCVKISDFDLSIFQKYGSKIQSLSLSTCINVTDVGLASVAFGCPLLSVISLSICPITDTGLQILAKSCKGLIEVILFCCQIITDRGIQSIIQNCRQLRALDIRECRKIVGVGFHGCPSTLAFLRASSCLFESTGVTKILSGGGLEYLNLAYHHNDIGHGLVAIGLGFATNLKILDFALCKFVNDDVVISISKGCPLLREWNLTCCGNIGISGWESIGLHCQKLWVIHVGRCKNLCDQGLLSLGNGCKRLTVIYMTQCIHITPAGKRLFKIQREDVKIKELEVTTTFPYWRFTWPFTKYLSD